MCTQEDKKDYKPRRPQESLLYNIVNDNLAEFLASAGNHTDGKGLPDFVVREFDKFLQCGCYESGLVPVECLDNSCADKYYVPASCKNRGFCSSCGGRRMNVSAINLSERVLPWVPVRQWVVTVPIPLRYLMAVDHQLLLSINRLVTRVIKAFIRKKARRQGIKDGVTGAVTFVQRFNSGLQVSPHFHILFLDGVYKTDPGGERPPFFIRMPPLTNDEVLQLTKKICNKVTGWLIKAGWLAKETQKMAEDAVDPLADKSPVLSATCQASVVNRIALGIRAGKKVRRIGASQFGFGNVKAEITGEKCAKYGGFTLHAATRISSNERERLENLIRYVARPAISLERMSLTSDGDIEYKLKFRWRDGTSSLLFSPSELLERLTALVPYPQKNLIIYSGCLAPNHNIRPQIISLENNGSEDNVEGASSQTERKSRYISWQELLKKTWGLDLFSCRRCGGPTKIGRFISDPNEIQKIMSRVGLAPRPPPGGGSTGELRYEPETDDDPGLDF